jgi:hypothetical protein
MASSSRSDRGTPLPHPLCAYRAEPPRPPAWASCCLPPRPRPPSPRDHKLGRGWMRRASCRFHLSLITQVSRIFPFPSILLATQREYSHRLASYWPQRKSIPISWHPIGPNNHSSITELTHQSFNHSIIESINHQSIHSSITELNKQVDALLYIFLLIK